jgi:O-Antigen ligase
LRKAGKAVAVTTVASRPTPAGRRPLTPLAAAVAFGPSVLAFAACVLAVGVAHAGYFPDTWYPAGIAAGALLAVVAIARPDAAVPRGGRLAIALLAGWTALSGLSMLWVDSPAAGWQATDKLLAILSVAVLISLAPWRPRSALVLVGAWAGSVALIAGVDMWSFAGEARPYEWLLEGRYNGPIEYANGTAVVAAMAFWPAVILSARPATPWPARLLLLPASVVLLAWALLPSSRATVGVFVVIAPVALAMCRHRWRLLARLAIAAAAIAPAARPLSHIYTAAREEQPLRPFVDSMAEGVLVAVLVALVASAVLLAVEHRVRPSPAFVASAGRAGRIAIVAGLVCAVAAGIALQGRISDEVDKRWDAFHSLEEENTQTGARLGQITSDKRSDYWRVAIDTFEDQPLAGIGAGGFERRYTAEKRFAKHSRYAHSIWLRALGDTGILGFLLLAGGVLALLLAVVRRRIAGAGDPELLAATLAASAFFFLQASVDWLEEVPVLTAVALALPLVALAATARREPPRQAGSWAQRLPLAALGLASVVALVSPWLAVRWIERGDGLRAVEPAAAYEAYDRAAGFNGLDSTPRLRSGFVALDQEDFPRARREFERAIDVEETWLPQLELGLLDLRAGRFDAASRRIERARQLNRHDPLIAEARAAARERRRVDPREINRLVFESPVFSQP